jgi:hypothetical protein
MAARWGTLSRLVRSIHCIIAHFGDVKDPLYFGKERRELLRKQRIVLGGLDEVQQTSPLRDIPAHCQVQNAALCAVRLHIVQSIAGEIRFLMQPSLLSWEEHTAHKYKPKRFVAEVFGLARDLSDVAAFGGSRDHHTHVDHVCPCAALNGRASSGLV